MTISFLQKALERAVKLVSGPAIPKDLQPGIQQRAFEKAGAALNAAWSLNTRVVEDTDYPVAPHIQELRKMLAQVIPFGMIYGSSIYNSALKHFHPELELFENDIDIGLVRNDIITQKTGEDDLHNLLAQKLEALRQQLPAVTWDKKDEVRGSLSNAGLYDNVEGSFTGRWTDESGKTHKLQFNFGRSQDIVLAHKQFFYGDSILASAAMEIYSGKVMRHVDQMPHAKNLIFAAGRDMIGYRAEKRYAALAERVPGLKYVGYYSQLPHIKREAEELRAEADRYEKIGFKLNEGERLTRDEVKAALALAPTP